MVVFGIRNFCPFSRFFFYQKRKNQRLIQQQEVLEKTLQEQSHTIQVQSDEIKMQAEKLRKLNEVKARLMADISHESKPSYDRFIEKCKNVVDENYKNPSFSVDDWAGQIYMSRAQFFRRIKSELGVTPLQFIRTYRLEKAKELLNENAGNGSEVAYMVGFNSPNYFFKCFKEEYGMTVGDFVKS